MVRVLEAKCKDAYAVLPKLDRLRAIHPLRSQILRFLTPFRGTLNMRRRPRSASCREMIP